MNIAIIVLSIFSVLAVQLEAARFSFIAVKMRDSAVLACIDTGSSFSFISADYAKLRHHEIEQLKGKQILTPNFEMYFKHHSLTYDPIMVTRFPQTNFPFRILLGCNFLVDNNVCINFSNTSYSINRIPDINKQLTSELKEFIFVENNNIVYGCYYVFCRNNIKYSLLVDTGSTHTIVNTNDIPLPQLCPCLQSNLTYTQHFTGRKVKLIQNTKNNFSDSILLNHIYSADLGKYLARHDHGDIKCAGILGLDNLRHNKIIIDFGQKKVYK